MSTRNRACAAAKSNNMKDIGLLANILFGPTMVKHEEVS